MGTVSNINQRLRAIGSHAGGGSFDSGGGGRDDGGMEARITAIESANLETRDRLARIETRLNEVATKTDLYKAINALTWKLVTFVCSFGTALVAVTYFVATHLTPATSTPTASQTPIVIQVPAAAAVPAASSPISRKP